MAKGDQILAVPTLVGKLPLPVRKIIGDYPIRSEHWSGWISGREHEGTIAMPKKPIQKETAAFERAIEAAAASGDRYVLRLYVAGISPKSSSAIRAVTQICEENLKGRYELEVIDLYQKPNLAKGEQIIAAPTLIKKLPLPLRRVIGDMANRERVLVGLDLRPKSQ